MGIALFVAISMCLRVPVYDNFYVCLGYVIMTVYMYLFTPLDGIVVGCFGTAIYCLLIGGTRGMPGWVLANIVIGINVGLVLQMIKHGVFQNKLIKYLAIATVTVLAVGIGIFGVKSILESIIYAQPVIARMVTNTPAFVTDTIVIIFSVPFCEILERNKHIACYISRD